MARGQVDRLGVDRRVGEALLGAGEVDRDEPVGDAVRLEVAHEREVRLGRVRAHQRGDQPDLDPGRRRRAPGATRRRLDDLPAGQALGRVEQRRPADLGVADVVARLVLDEVARDPVDRLVVLHEGDREVEGLEQLGLVGRLVGPDEDASHAGEGRRGVDAPRAGDVERGVDPERAVEVEVQLGLGHRSDERADGSRVEVGHGAMVGGCAALANIVLSCGSPLLGRARGEHTMATILVTGASGFVGSHVMPGAHRRGASGGGAGA